MSTDTERTHAGHADLEQRLRRELGQLTVAMPADMITRAHRAYRKRLITVRATAITGATAVIAVTATVVAMVGPSLSRDPDDHRPAASQAGPPDALPARLRPQPPGDDLSAKQAATDIVWTRVATPTASSPEVTQQLSFAGSTRDVSYYPDGAPSADALSTTVVNADGSRTLTQISVGYLSRTWSSQSSTSPAAAFRQSKQAVCASARQLGAFGDVSLASADGGELITAIGWLLACGGLAVTRGLRIDGISATAMSGDSHGLRETLWINAATGVPIQFTKVPDDAQSPGAMTQTYQYGFLPPTRANLRHVLAFTLEPGFTRYINSAPSGSSSQAATKADVWVPPAGVIPPFGLEPVPAGNDLTASQAGRDILWTRQTTAADPATDTVIDSTFAYKTATRELTYYPGGRPWDDSQVATVAGPGGTPQTYDTVVDYQDRSWSRSGTSFHGLSGQQAPCTLGYGYGVAAGIGRSLLSCHALTITRGARVDGIGAITISNGKGATMWINAVTYLPIQEVVSYARGDYPAAGYDNTPSPEQTYQYTFLPPTKASLAYLGIPVPAGFRP
jgi:hypothetical protein